MKRHTKASIKKMLASRRANRAAKPLKEPDIHSAIILLKMRVRVISDKPYRDLDENELTILQAYRSLTVRR